MKNSKVLVWSIVVALGGFLFGFDTAVISGAEKAIQQVRLNKAKFLLRRDDLTIADVAYKVGFSSPTYFSTAFKGKYNQTPMEYKKS